MLSKKILGIFMTFFIVMAMILTSCATETTEEEATVVTGKLTTPAPEITKPEDTTREEKPQYGGIVTLALTSDITGFDEIETAHTFVYTVHLTNDELLQGDWTKGQAGTGEADWLLGGINNMDLKAGALADTWEIPERGKMIFHIREGVYFHNKPPTNGRELTVEDVVFSLERICNTPSCYVTMAYPGMCRSVVITGDEAARTVTIECPLTEWPNAVTIFPDYCSIVPKDAVDYYGGDLNDWRNSLGTGAFILTDYISNGSATLVRNDNYWETNPIGPGKGDQLPYIDGIKLLIISDTSTRMAALRTAKIEGTGGEYDDVKEFLDHPDMKYMMYTSDASYVIGMRQDKPESPFSKKEVRQAMFYATDFAMIKDDYYGGKAVVLNWPIAQSKEAGAAYVPLEDLPANIQDLYSYNPDKAKDLLTAAGYPNGFETSVVCYNTPTHVDYLSLVKEMWSKVNITLNIDAKEYAIWVSRIRARNYDDLLYTYTSGAWQKMINFSGPSQYNVSYIDDPVVAEAVAKIPNYVGVDEEGLAQLNAELMPYLLEQCYVLSKPTAYSYVVWWRWRKNWNGELNTGYYNYPGYLKYTWSDIPLKQELTGRQ